MTAPVVPVVVASTSGCARSRTSATTPHVRAPQRPLPATAHPAPAFAPPGTSHCKPRPREPRTIHPAQAIRPHQHPPGTSHREPHPSIQASRPAFNRAPHPQHAVSHPGHASIPAGAPPSKPPPPSPPFPHNARHRPGLALQHAFPHRASISMEHTTTGAPRPPARPPGVRPPPPGPRPRGRRGRVHDQLDRGRRGRGRERLNRGLGQLDRMLGHDHSLLDQWKTASPGQATATAAGEREGTGTTSKATQPPAEQGARASPPAGPRVRANFSANTPATSHSSRPTVCRGRNPRNENHQSRRPVGGPETEFGSHSRAIN